MGWMRRNGYGRALDAVWGPLLRQKYGRRAEDVGLVWLWGKIALRTRSRDETGLGERLGYVKGSFGRGVAAVLQRVRERGGDVRTSRPVRIVKRGAGGFDVTFAGGTEAFDLVLSTVAIPELLRLAPDLPEETRRLWSAISYCHALCPILELDRPLSPYYWLNVGDEAMPFGGVIEHTNFLSPEDYGGRHVVYLSNYVLPDDPKWKRRDEELWAEYLPALKVVNPSFDESWILAKQIGRAEYAQPIIVPHYSKLLPPLQTPVPGPVVRVHGADVPGGPRPELRDPHRARGGGRDAEGAALSLSLRRGEGAAGRAAPPPSAPRASSGRAPRRRGGARGALRLRSERGGRRLARRARPRRAWAAGSRSW